MNTANTYPKVSVVMTTYNRAGYILESVESVRNQSYTNWELVIVDDGSTDETEILIAELGDPRIRFHKAGKIGLGIRLKHIGIQLCEGDFIAFIDSDDLWAPDKLNKQVAAMQQYPEAGFSITGGYNFRRLNEPIEFFYKEREGLKYGNIFFSFFRSEASILPPTLIINIHCLQEIQQSIEDSPNSDVEFLLDLAIKFKAVILYESLFYRRIHDDSFSGKNWEKGYEEGVRLIRLYRNRKMLPDKLADDASFRLYINYGESCLKHKNTKLAIRIFFRSWISKPFSIVPLKKMVKALFQ